MKNILTFVFASFITVMSMVKADDVERLKFPVGAPVSYSYKETSSVEMPLVTLGEKTILNWEIVVEEDRGDEGLVVACTLKDAKVYLVGKALFSLKKKVKTAYQQLVDCPLRFVVGNECIRGQVLSDEELESAVQMTGFRGKLLEFLARSFALRGVDLYEDALYSKYEMMDPNGLDYWMLNEQDKEQRAQLVEYVIRDCCFYSGVPVALRARDQDKVIKGFMDLDSQNALQGCGYSIEREYSNADLLIKWPEIDGLPPIDNLEGKFTVFTAKNDKHWRSHPCFPPCCCADCDYGYLHCYN